MDSNKRPDTMERITTPALAKAFIDEKVAEVRAQVGDKKVLLALSGGIGAFDGVNIVAADSLVKVTHDEVLVGGMHTDNDLVGVLQLCYIGHQLERRGCERRTSSLFGIDTETIDVDGVVGTFYPKLHFPAVLCAHTNDGVAQINSFSAFRLIDDKAVIRIFAHLYVDTSASIGGSIA